jgi:hypothetical protein
MRHEPWAVSHLRATRAWLKSNGKDTFWPFDFVAAVIATAASFIATLQSKSIQTNGLVFLGAIAALGIALTAIVATVLTLVVTLFDDTYRQALQATDGGWPAAVRPYKTIAFVSVLATVLAIAGLFVWGVAFAWLKALILASSGGLAGLGVTGYRSIDWYNGIPRRNAIPASGGYGPSKRGPCSSTRSKASRLTAATALSHRPLLGLCQVGG